MTRSRLYVLDGTSGVWKRELLDYTARRLSNAETIKKLTTRAPREGEDFSALDLEQISPEGFKAASPDYSYQYGGNWYGFTKASLVTALRSHENVFVIVRNAGVIRHLRDDFDKYCPTVAFVYVDSALAARKAQELSSNLVKTSIEDAYRDYLREPELYDEVLIHGGAPDDLYRLVNVLVSRGLAREFLLVKVGKRVPIAIATTGPTKALIVFLNSMMFTACLAIAVNLLTGGSIGDWQGLTLALAVLVMCLSLVVNILFLYGWQKRRE